MSEQLITPADRARLAELADVVFPRTAEMPSASDVGASGALADRVVRFVPSLAADLHTALGTTSAAGEGALTELRERNRRLFNRLMLLIASAYYLSPDVRQKVGYPGQEARKLDFFEVPAYLEDGTLDRVIERGRRWVDVDRAPGGQP